MPKEPESKEEMIKRLTKQFEKLLKEKLPDEPGTLEEIEKITGNYSARLHYILYEITVASENICGIVDTIQL